MPCRGSCLSSRRRNRTSRHVPQLQRGPVDLWHVGRRAENLVPTQTLEELALVLFVELREDVIEQHDRPFSPPQVEEGSLQEKECEHAHPLLAARSEGEQIPAIGFDAPVIAVRAHGRGLEEEIPLAVVQQ